MVNEFLVIEQRTTEIFYCKHYYYFFKSGVFVYVILKLKSQLKTIFKLIWFGVGGLFVLYIMGFRTFLLNGGML